MDKLTFIERVPIMQGWSNDKKYCVTSTDGMKYLLRNSTLEHYDNKKKEFEMMEEVASLHIPLCRPIAFGVCDEGIYSLHSWIDGIDADQFIGNEQPYQQ